MEKTYTIGERNSILTIKLSQRKPAIIILGLSALAVGYSLVAFIFFSILTHSFHLVFENPGTILFLLIMVIPTLLYFFMARSFIRRLTLTESLIVDPQSLTLVSEYLFGKQSRKFQLEHVTEIFFAGAENYSQHPLDGNYVDIAGVRGMEAVIRYQITDGNIMLIYGKRQIRFGKNIPSWDTEEIVAAIEKYTGKNFTPKPKADTYTERPKYRGGGIS